MVAKLFNKIRKPGSLAFTLLFTTQPPGPGLAGCIESYGARERKIWEAHASRVLVLTARQNELCCQAEEELERRKKCAMAVALAGTRGRVRSPDWRIFARYG
jgi:hypothetical protein